jgi:hypothetical protein
VHGVPKDGTKPHVRLEEFVTLPVREEIRVMFAPVATYSRLREAAPGVGAGVLLPRPALVALIIGAFVTLSNAGELFPTLLLGSTVAFAWVPALQMAVAAGLMLLFGVARVNGRPFASTLDLFFVGHGPWSLWLLGVTAVMMAELPLGLESAAGMRLVALTAVVPIAWTSVILFVFSRSVLALSVVPALGFTLLYEAIIWACAYLYVGAATFRLWPFALHRAFLP